MLALSVIVCAHNPREAYFRKAIEALRRQDLDLGKWELVIVDNASAEPLARIWDLSWHPHGRHVLESKLGLSAARRRGMREARAPLMIFVDDDNILAPDYLSSAVGIASDWPWLGTFGSGSIEPEFELEPKPHLSKLVPNLALRESTTARWSNVYPCTDATPWGAGLCVTRPAADAYSMSENRGGLEISGRRGAVLLSGEDVDISYAACAAGYGMGVFPELKLTHLIPKERVSEAYLLRLFEGILASNYMLSYKWKGLEPWSPLSPRNVLSVIKNGVLRRGLDRRMYFAGIRAALQAQRLIAAAKLGAAPKGEAA
jgi:glycosyltransferase involved in cell wall biosynthesis